VHYTSTYPKTHHNNRLNNHAGAYHIVSKQMAIENYIISCI
jgi:hypothetical protein